MPRVTTTWSPVKTLRFISLYKSYDFLWNPDHEEFDDRKRRYDGIKEMAFAFEIDMHDVEMKILELRTIFTTEIRKMKKSLRAGGEVYVPKWFALKPLLFLLGMNRRQKEWEYSSEAEDEEQPEAHIETLGIEHAASVTSTTGEAGSVPPPRAASGSVPRAPGRPRRTMPSRRARDERTRLRLDKYEYFGQYVAMKLKLIKRRQIRLLVQRKMNSILQKAEAGKYDVYLGSRRIPLRAIVAAE